MSEKVSIEQIFADAWEKALLDSKRKNPLTIPLDSDVGAVSDRTEDSSTVDG